MSGMEPYKIAFKVGMTMQNTHTFFDYVFNYPNFDKETGKKTSGWVHAFDAKPFGSYPATLDDIKTDQARMKLFVKTLIGHQIHVDDDVKDLLFT
eukprot:11755180-Ditylum_brightwellii.AAC.1